MIGYFKNRDRMTLLNQSFWHSRQRSFRRGEICQLIHRPLLGCRPRGPHFQLDARHWFICPAALCRYICWNTPPARPLLSMHTGTELHDLRVAYRAATVLNSPRHNSIDETLRSIAVVEDCWMLSVNVGCAGNAPDADFLFPLPGLGDVVGRLHPHERVHLHAESLFDA